MYQALKSLSLVTSTLLLSLASPLKIPADISALFSKHQVLAQTPASWRVQATQLYQKGIEQYQTSQLQAALQSWQQALTLYRENKDRQNEGATLGNLGIASYSLGDYAKAIDYQQQRLAIARELNDRRGEGNALGNLGSAYRSLGDYTQAIDYFQQHLAIARELKDRKNEGNTLGNLGSVYSFLGDYAKAIKYGQQHLAIAREINDRRGEENALAILGSAYSFLGDHPKAVEYGQQQLTIAQEIKDPQSEGSALGNLGMAYSFLRDYAKAIKYNEQWLDIARKIGDLNGEGTALNNLGVALLSAGNLPKAESTLRAAIQARESLRERLGSNDANKVAIFEQQAQTYRHLQQVLIAQNKTEAALEIAERGRARAFIELLATRLSSNPNIQSTIEPPTIEQIRQVASEQNATLVEYSIVSKERLYIWVVQPTGKVIFRQVDLTLLETNLAEAVRRTNIEAFSGRGQFQPDSVLADLVRGTLESVEVKRGDATNKQAMAGTSSGYRSYRRLQQMYRLLIKPIADLLPTDPESRVVFIPQSSLFLIPFPALQDETGKYLIEKHTILTAPSIQVLQLTHSSRKQSGAEAFKPVQAQDALVVGNPTMPSVPLAPGEKPMQLQSLPGAQKEAEAIATLLKTKPLIGNLATKAIILQQLPQARIIHLATHGLLDDVRGLKSAIALTPTGEDDGLLTAEQLLNLKLNAELVVLSACNTGRGRITGDGVIGLSRSLISAGASSVIVSLWAVPDAPTSDLMTEFYRNLQQNFDKAQALRSAMLTTMKQHPEPKDWAAFTLIGEVD